MWANFVGQVMLKSANGRVVAFIHCTSHGLIFKGDEHQNTWIVHNEPNSFTNIQELIIDLGLKANVTVFAIMDACRTWSTRKNDYTSTPMIGEAFIGYGARPGKPALAPGELGSPS